MRKLFYAIILLTLSLCCHVAGAQNFRGGYFLDYYPYAYKLNPAFGYDSDFLAPLFGQSVTSVKSPLSLKDFIYPSADGKKLVTGLHSDVDANTFLSAFNRKQNSVILEEDYTLFAYGFKYGGSYHVFDVSFRSGVAVNAPYDVFEFMKVGTERRTSFDFSDMFAKTHTWLEASYGRTFEISDRLTLGARQKIIAGLSYGSLHLREMHLNLASDHWKIESDSDMEIAGKALDYKLSKDVEGKTLNEIDVFNTGIKPAGLLGLNGVGMAFDAGLEWKATKELTLSASILDFGGIKWFDSMYAKTKKVYYTYDPTGSIDDKKGNPTSGLSAILKFRPRGKKKNSFDPLTVSFNFGAKYRLPFYDRMSVGILGVYKVDNIFNWWELRPSLNATPLDWLSLSVSTGLSRYGTSYGAVASVRTKYLQFFAGTDSYVREFSPQFIPLTKLNHNVVAGIVVPLESRGRDNLMFRLWRWSLKPSAKLDEDWILQPVKGWSFSNGYELARTGAELNAELSVRNDNGYGKANMELKLEDRAAHTLKTGIGYGPFSLSVSREVGKGTSNSSSFDFSYLASYYGIDVRHRKYSSLAKAVVSLELDTLGKVPGIPLKSGETVDMYDLIIDGYYAFNRKHFCYSAAYDGKMIQRRTAGSWMATAQYMQGRLDLDNRDNLLMEITRGLGQFSTTQFSLGGGYSVNLVQYHRDPRSAADLQGLRNITFNLTVMPLLTVFSRSVSGEYLQTKPNEYSGKISKEYALVGYLQPNIIMKAGFSVGLGHFIANLWADYNTFRYDCGERSFPSADNGTTRMRQDGGFYNFRLCFGLRYRL